MPQDDDYSTDDLQVQVFDGLLALTRHSRPAGPRNAHDDMCVSTLMTWT